MSDPPVSKPSLLLFGPPYEELMPHLDSKPLEYARGVALVWVMGEGNWRRSFEVCRDRPPGLPLITVLPPALELKSAPQVLRVVEACRPHSILPHHPDPHLDDLTVVLRRIPSDLPMELLEYVAWRGVRLDPQTRHLLRRTLELSTQVHTVSGLARSLYLSRRALGRRFMTRGVPVPSHWLHFGRIVRAALRLQGTDQNVMSIAYDLGYSDGFALSNQMLRLAGVRPSEVREHFGWEWITEEWLRTEAAGGGLSTSLHRRFALRSPTLVLSKPAQPSVPPQRPSRARGQNELSTGSPKARA